MKRWFARMAAKIGRFVGSWRFLKFVLVTVTLIILFYAEEDWRGARAWAATKAKWEARGETFDFAQFVPKPVPDDENLGGIPILKLAPQHDGNGKTELAPVALRAALGNRSYDNDFPPSNNWREGMLPDFEQIRTRVAARYVEAFKEPPHASDSLEQLQAIYPFLGDLRVAENRPYCQFQFDGSVPMPAGRMLTLIVSQVLVSKIVATHALLEMERGNADASVRDLKLNFKLDAGVRRDPAALIAGLCAMGMVSISEGIIFDGLARHFWSDEQLLEMEDVLAPVDFLVDYRRALQGEAVEVPRDVDYVKTASASEQNGFWNGGNPVPSFLCPLPFLWPRGWLDLNKAGYVSRVLDAVSCFNPKTRRVFPAAANELLSNSSSPFDGRYVLPWNFLAASASTWLPEEPPKFAQAQVWVDEARIACALERYRLARGTYPDTLLALAPGCIDALPHDVMNGEPYHYRVNADGTFLLYSVGWNQKDDGGKEVDEPGTTRRDDTQGDWVWPTAHS